ncbi:AI-2E family transporter [Methanimicrococcus blatticola]|uniref:Putative PurR-regulated permease PerM n=1 Tax=Methanimicrococcus blatticola TaxID=91560 RepID=A0A484F4I3_9EURY|nr:AI-2E family transporter [Methanimicrococcus blatticola]MBZ3935702.1 AI-2E family transporter [Methanimicrococcus blatticola]MCC2508177.1 AI-2E family transporter [Methanimicrococcus blatticola]TDQ68746.1 putative PurR-regulated permease PerM [Methanimicrococcus blatticola]
MANTKTTTSSLYQVPLPLTTNKRVWLSMILVFAALCAVIMTLFYFSELFIVILFGLCFIALLNKAVNLFNKYTGKYTRKQRQVMAIAIVMLAVVVCGSVFLTQINNLSDLFSDLSGLQAMILQGTDIFIEMLSVLPDAVTNWVQNMIDSIVNTIFSYTGILLSQAFFYILAIVLLYPIMFKMYFKDGSRIKSIINNAVPKRFETEFKYTANAILTQSNNFFVAKIIESIGIALICCVGFYLIGLPGWLFLGILAGLLNNVPYIGPIFATIPPIIVGLVIGWKIALLAIVVCLIAQIVDNIYLVPFMISSKVSVNPFTTVLLILTFSQLYGALGMILSIPIYIICKIILVESYKLLIRIFPETQV